MNTEGETRLKPKQADPAMGVYLVNTPATKDRGFSALLSGTDDLSR